MLERLERAVTGHPKRVLAAWLLAAAGLTLFVPQLEKVISRDATSFLPPSATSMRAFATMDREFGSGRGRSLAFVVLADGHRLTAADQEYYARLVRTLHRDHRHVAEAEDWLSTPALRPALVSRDGAAEYIPVALTGPVGSPTATNDIHWLRTLAGKDRPPGLVAHVTGDVATIADFNSTIQHSVARTTVIGVGIVLLILLMLYRNWFVPVVPLTTIGFALVCARGLVALLGLHGLTVSTYTPSFLTAILLGAGTDYSVFLIARHRDALRTGGTPVDAARHALNRLTPVLVASALTIIVGTAGMGLAHIALFRTTGPPIAVGVAVTLVAALTLTPALLTLAGTRIAPTPAGAAAVRWQRLSRRVTTTPVRALLAGLIPLLLLAALYPSLRPSFNEATNQPTSDDSSLGYRTLAAHFPATDIEPDYVLLSDPAVSFTDPRALAGLNEVTVALSRVPGVADVRSLTWPLGHPLPQTNPGWQDQQVAGRLATADGGVHRGAQSGGRLAGAAGQLSTGSAALAAGAGTAAGGGGALVDGLDRLGTGLAGGTTGVQGAQAGAGRLAAGAGQLASALQLAHDSTAEAVRGLGSAYQELSVDPVCSADPICSRVRAGIDRIYRAERDQLLPGLGTAAAAAAAIASGDGGLAAGLGRLRAGLGQAQQATATLRAGAAALQAGLGRLQHGASSLTSGAAQLATGAATIATDTVRLASGLGSASRFLAGAGRSVQTLDPAAFYLPAGAVSAPAFALARQMYLAPDGHTVRLLVDGTANPYGRAAMRRDLAESAAVRSALRGTALAGASVQVAGMSAVDNDLSSLSAADFRLVAGVILAAVALVLMLLLRSLVAPIYLLASVVLSYGAAMGLTILVWQDLLHRPLDWTVSFLAFMILVAVGADYNILLTSRIREEALDGRSTRSAVRAALASTGPVITSAGLIFAGSLAALLAAGVTNLEETGFVMATGLLLDTFLVRSLVVPAVTALVGERAWWPAGAIRPRGRTVRLPAEPVEVRTDHRVRTPVAG